jgi:hypothetical protein
MGPPMDTAGNTTEALSAGQLLTATAGRLRERRDDLAPLVEEYDRVQRIADTFGELPDREDRASSLPEYAELVPFLHATHEQLRDWGARLEPLVREYEQILHVLAAMEAAETLTPGRRRPRRPRAAGGGQSGGARADELRALLTEPRARAQIAEQMGLSPARVTELLGPLARAGEIVEIRDPERPTRKLWVLAEHGGSDGEAAATATPADAA